MESRWRLKLLKYIPSTHCSCHSEVSLHFLVQTFIFPRIAPFFPGVVCGRPGEDQWGQGLMCPRPGEEQSLVIDHEFKHRTWDNDRNGQNILRISVDHSFGLADDADGDIRIDCGVFFPTEAVVKSWPQQPGSRIARLSAMWACSGRPPWALSWGKLDEWRPFRWRRASRS